MISTYSRWLPIKARHDIWSPTDSSKGSHHLQSGDNEPVHIKRGSNILQMKHEVTATCILKAKKKKNPGTSRCLMLLEHIRRRVSSHVFISPIWLGGMWQIKKLD